MIIRIPWNFCLNQTDLFISFPFKNQFCEIMVGGQNRNHVFRHFIEILYVFVTKLQFSYDINALILKGMTAAGLTGLAGTKPPPHLQAVNLCKTNPFGQQCHNFAIASSPKITRITRISLLLWCLLAVFKQSYILHILLLKHYNSSLDPRISSEKSSI